MSGMVTLTLTGAKRFTIAGTVHTVEKWQQCRVDKNTAEHLLDQYFTDKNNQEQPYFEEGVVEKPIPRADRKRVRASQRRLDREAAKAQAKVEAQAVLRDARDRGDPIDADDMQAFRQEAGAAQDPYKRVQHNEDAPDWAVNKDVAIGPVSDDDLSEDVVVEAAPRPQVAMEVTKPKPTPRKRASKKTAKKGTRSRKKAA